MRYAKVVLGLPVDEVFDYLVPEHFSKYCFEGCRVGVSFGRRNLIGYVVGMSLKTKIKKIKPISRLIDVKPILDGNFLKLTKIVSDYYCSSWGQAIEAALPVGVRKGLPVGGVDEERKTAPRVTDQLSGETCDFSLRLTPPRLPLLRGGFLSSLPPRGEEMMEVNPLPQIAGKYLPPFADWLPRRERAISEVYSERIDVVLAQNKSVLILAPEIKQCWKLFNLIKAKYPDKRIEVTYRKLKIKDELAVWEKAGNGWVDVLIGTRAAVFSPLPHLGLIIIEEEDAYGYKEEQSPYYHARDVGFMRSRLEGIPLILSSQALSLDAYYGLKEKEYSSIVTGHLLGETRNFSPPLTPPTPPLAGQAMGGEMMEGNPLLQRGEGIDLSRVRITLVDLKQYGKKKSGMLFSPVLEDKLNKAIPAGKKVLIFINRKGYARFAHCQKCGFVLSCDKCSSRLIFHFEEKKLICSSCGFRTDLLRICPSCNSQYIKYSGFGIEKAVSQLNLYFPQAKTVRLDKEHQDIPQDFQIVVATEKIFHCDIQPRFDISAVIDLDSVLNMVDFRNNEKLYRLLYKLKSLTREDLIIQTRVPEQYQNKEFLNLELNKLFEGELKERKELKLPPYTHLTQINLRGKNLERVKSAALGLYEKLKGINVTGQLSRETRDFSPRLTPPTRGGEMMKGNPLLRSGEGIARKYLPSLTGRLHTNKDFEIFEPVESIPSKLRGNFRFYMLLKAKNQLKLSKFLKKQLKKIRYSGVILTVEVDPE